MTDTLLTSITNLTITKKELESFHEQNKNLPNKLLKLLFGSFNYININFNHVKPEIVDFLISYSHNGKDYCNIGKYDKDRSKNTSSSTMENLYRYVRIMLNNVNDNISKIDLVKLLIHYCGKYDLQYIHDFVPLKIFNLIKSLNIDNCLDDYSRDKNLCTRYTKWINSISDIVSDSDMVEYAELDRFIYEEKISEIFVKDNFINLHHIDTMLKENILPDNVLEYYLDSLEIKEDDEDNSEYGKFDEPYQALDHICYDTMIIETLFKYSKITNPQLVFDKLVKYIQNEYNDTCPTPKHFCDVDGEIYNDDYDEIILLLEYNNK